MSANVYDVEFINKVIEILKVLNRVAFVFAVTAENLQVWWKKPEHKINKTERASFTGWCL